MQWSLLLATDLIALFYNRKQVLLVLYKGNITEEQGNVLQHPARMFCNIHFNMLQIDLKQTGQLISTTTIQVDQC